MICKIKVEKVPIRLLVNFVGTAPTFFCCISIYGMQMKIINHILNKTDVFFPL